MTYQLLYTKSAFHDIKKLEEYTANPLKNAKRLSNTHIGTYGWRIGNYRIVFDIDKNRIVILRVGHRREIYK